MKYWVYLKGQVPGSYTPRELAGLDEFSATTLVCPAEGEIREKNWRRSGEFADIVSEIQERDAARQPAPPLADPGVAADVGAMLDSAGARLYGQVSELMRQLESQREERALIQTLQRRLVELTSELTNARERASELEVRVAGLAGLEETARRDHERVAELEDALKARDSKLSDLRADLEKTHNEHDAVRRTLQETSNDLTIRNRLVDTLSRDLANKEMSLTKALTLIRMLEENLHRVTPGAGDSADAPAAPSQMLEPSRPEPPMPAVRPVVDSEADEPQAQLSSAQPPSPPDEPLPSEAPAAQTAITQLFKRLISRDLHS